MARLEVRNHRIRVMHLTFGFNVGGLERLLIDIARHVDRERVELRFVSLGSCGTLSAEIKRNGWPVTGLEFTTGISPAVVLRLARLLRASRPHILHTHNTGPLIYGGAAARLVRIPAVVHTRHGQRFGATRRETTLFRLASRLVDRVVCVSEDSARLSVAEGIEPGRICRIANGIDLSRFEYRGPHVNGPIVTVSRLSAEKGVETLVKAAALVVRERPSIRFEIAGNGPCYPTLRQLVSDLNLSEHVGILGEVRDVSALLGRAGAFVLPSRTEGMSLTLLEAMATGLPVVATRVGGNPEVVEEGETGLLVPAESPRELAAAILRLQKDATLGSRMGLAGRRRAEQRFDVRRMVLQYESVYRRLCGCMDRSSARRAHWLPGAHRTLRHADQQASGSPPLRADASSELEELRCAG